jgi:2-methylisocitrate lyase-like PEP mutase family enzyme
MGEPDNDASDARLIFNDLARIAAAVEVPLTADLQAGLRLAPDDFVDQVLHAGIVGCNLEDTDHHGPAVLVDAERQAAYLAAVRDAAEARGVHLVINARIDAFIRKAGSEAEQAAEALRRGRLYLAAGADCVYPIGLADRDVIARLVAELPGPVNIIARHGGLSVSELTALGVRRVSMGAGIHQLVMADLGARLARLAAGDALADAWPAG